MRRLLVFLPILFSLNLFAAEYGNRIDGVFVANKSDIKIVVENKGWAGVGLSENKLLHIEVSGESLFTGYTNSMEYAEEYAKPEIEERISEINSEKVVLDLRYIYRTEDSKGLLELVLNLDKRILSLDDFIQQQEELVKELKSL